MYSINIHLSATDDLYHLSNALSGLFQLSADGEARIRFSSGSAIDRDRGAVVLVLEVQKERSGPVCFMAIDLFDRGDYFDAGVLERCDVYYKRSFFSPYLQDLPLPVRARIRPFGLNYACRTGVSTVRTLAHLIPGYVRRAHRLKAREMADLLRKFLASPTVESFEYQPSQPADPLVCFQTRLWEPEAVLPDSAEEINELRVELVRRLKKEFGVAFSGGLVPNGFTLKRYPDAIANHSSRRSSYVARSRRALIGVSTRGLHYSMPFKFPEYLASSKCIVSDPIRNVLPAPLLRDKNYFEFRTADQCVEQCSRIFQDRALAEQMRHQNWHYYKNNVRCDRLLLRCFDDAFRDRRCSEKCDREN